MLGEEKVKQLCDQVLRRAGSGAMEVLLSVKDEDLTRFANNTIHQNVSESDINLIARYIDGKKVGTAGTNRTGERALDELVERARVNAKASPENPDFAGLAEPASYQPVCDLDESTAEASPVERAQAVGEVCGHAAGKGLNASGAYTTSSGELAIANSLGLFAYHASSRADFQTVVMGADASGFAHRSAWRMADLPVAALGKQAIEKAERGSDPRKIEPGEYTVVLDPYVTQDILSMLNFSGMSAMAVQEGRSWMNERLGQRVMDTRVTVWDDGLDPTGLPMPFDFEGTPKNRIHIIREGVPLTPVYDRYTAKKGGVESTGHALPPTFRGMGPLATNLFMAPGDSSLEEMIRSTQRGLYITRFWYTRPVHPRDCLITGMTRDGVFMIENGELAYPVKNLRFTQSYVSALAQVEALSRETSLLAADYGGMAVRVPAIKINNFNFTGTTV